jgi:regulatory protein
MVSRPRAGSDSRSDGGSGEVPGDPEQDCGDPESVARTICLQQLTNRARSRAELATTLRKRGVPDDVAARVLDRFTEVGLIDDAALAQTLAAAQHRERGLAGRAVAAKLRQRGLGDEVVGAAVAAIDPNCERARAEALVRKRLPALAALPMPVQQRRLVGLLARKGYSPSVSWDVVGAALRRDPLDTEGGDDTDAVL